MSEWGIFCSNRSFLFKNRIYGATVSGHVAANRATARTIDVALNHCEWQIESQIVIASCI